MRILLNIIKKDNFVFFDPENKIHLNRVSPIGYATIISAPIKRAILTGAIIDVDRDSGIKVSEKVEEFNDKVLKAFNIARKIKVAKPIAEPVVEPIIKPIVGPIIEKEIESIEVVNKTSKEISKETPKKEVIKKKINTKE